MKLRYSPRALSDLAAISDYLMQRSPAGARKVERAIRDSVSLIEQFPLGGRTLRRHPHVRVMPVSRFPLLVFYTTTAGGLLILHIRHSARAPLGIDDD